MLGKMRKVLAQRILYIGVDDMDAAAKAVALGVFLTEHGVARGNFNSGDMDGRVAHNGAKGRHAGSNACLEYGFAGGTGNCRGQKHRINAGAVAFFGLENAEPAAQECVLGQRVRHG
jgi:hypothetical protein